MATSELPAISEPEARGIDGVLVAAGRGSTPQRSFLRMAFGGAERFGATGGLLAGAGPEFG
jgi:hypothetical protein